MRWRDLVALGHRAAAGESGPSAEQISTLRAELTHDNPVNRQLALSALHRIGQLDPATLVAAFGDASAEVRRRAAELAAAYPAVDLSRPLDDPDPAVIEVAAWACGEHEHVSEPVLARLLTLATDHDDPLVREAAVAALGAIGDQRAIDAVLHGCADKPAIRRRATLALAAFDDERATTTLRAALSDRDWQVRQAAEDVLAAIGEPATPSSTDQPTS